MRTASTIFFRLLVRKTQPLQNFLRYVRAYFFVAVKMDFTCDRIARRRHWLAISATTRPKAMIHLHPPEVFPALSKYD